MNEIADTTWTSMSDAGLAGAIGDFIKHHRLNQNRTQDEVAKSANLSRSTLSLLERGETVTLATLLRVLRVLDLLHIMEVFKINREISPIEYARLQKDKRQRARPKGSDKTGDKELGW
ncbi:MAG: helix-turn-helix transcriptional regulator [Bacteroidota bacterium]